MPAPGEQGQKEHVVQAHDALVHVEPVRTAPILPARGSTSLTQVRRTTAYSYLALVQAVTCTILALFSLRHELACDLLRCVVFMCVFSHPLVSHASR